MRKERNRDLGTQVVPLCYLQQSLSSSLGLVSFSYRQGARTHWSGDLFPPCLSEKQWPEEDGCHHGPGYLSRCRNPWTLFPATPLLAALCLCSRYITSAKATGSRVSTLSRRPVDPKGCPWPSALASAQCERLRLREPPGRHTSHWAVLDAASLLDFTRGISWSQEFLVDICIPQQRYVGARSRCLLKGVSLYRKLPD